MNEKHFTDVLLVGVDSNSEDKFTLVVGRKDPVKKETEILNLDFVIRIREYPRNKKGKKKSVVVD